MELSQRAKEILGRGSIKIRVTRSGMLQQMTFTVKRIVFGNLTYVALCTDRQIDMSELTRVAEEIGLPIEAPNGKAFPKGKSWSDFAGF